MDIGVALLSGFLATALAPFVFSVMRGAAGWGLAVVPAAIFAYFCTYLGSLPAEGVSVAFPWAADFGLRLSFRLDGLSLLFTLLISGMGAIVIVYAGGYLAGDERLGRLYALLLAFMASMLGVVLSDNLIAIFVFWELTSITSYLLIGFDHERPAARAAALQALIITGGGGLALLAGFVLLAQVGIAAGLSLTEAQEVSAWVSAGVSAGESPLYGAILVLVLLGAFTKSAQFPFHFWLPGAMEAPTPVSAYLHSATMVKAGVYLLARLTPLLGDTPAWQWSLMGAGTTTMLVGAMLAIQARDLKIILAHSTVSALGLLVLLLGLGSEIAAAAAMAFILAHALYKGALFLIAGAVDHGAGTRDVDKLSGLWRAMPITAIAAAAAALAMAAVPPFFGFIAKEIFYGVALEGPAATFIISSAVAASAIFVVVALMVGLGPFWGKYSQAASHAHEVSWNVWVGPVALASVGLMLGLVPWFVDEPLLSPATQAVLGRPEPTALHLALWHGWNLPLALSLATLAGGIALYCLRRPFAAALAPLSAKGPANIYDYSLAGFLKFADLLTHTVQSGYLRYYLMTVFAAFIGLIGFTAFIREQTFPSLSDIDIQVHEAGIYVLIPLACWATIRAPSRLAAIVALGVVGYSVALIFVFFGAPDLAMTQFLVETLTVVLFVFVFYRLPTQQRISSFPARVRDAAIAVTVGCIVTGLVLFTTETSRNRELTEYYVAHSVPEAHGRNIVNVILVDFRALDTLGEITVLVLAAVGVYSLIKLRPPEDFSK